MNPEAMKTDEQVGVIDLFEDDNQLAPALPQLDPDMNPMDANEVAESFDRDLEGDNPLSDDDRVKQERAKVRDMMNALGAYHQRQAEERVALRAPVEQRWIEDLRQYHSQYDPELLADIRAAKGSEVFVNITAPKTDGFSARMADMILPTDGKNWAIKPTPVPEVQDALGSEEVVGQTAEGADIQARDIAKGINDVVRDRCSAMEREMDDQLAECQYNAVQRKGIDQCAQLGTMVLKGPIVIGRIRRIWERQEDPTGVVHVLRITEDRRPAVEFVDVWDFFPCMNVPDPNVGEDVYQRHYKTKRELRALAKQPGFDKEAIRRILKEDRRPMVTALHLQQLREIAGEYATTQIAALHELWEYHGPITAEELSACGVDLGDKKDSEDFDPLDTLDAVLWFCEGVVIKAMLKPSETDDGLGYHVTWVKKDETSPFGFGIPRMMRNSQSVANASWRMVMDNAGLALAPQIIFAMGVIPADGKWDMYPGKIWIAKEGVVDVRHAMLTFDMPIRLKELLIVFETALKLADEETSMSIIMQGQNGPAVPETAEGMAMLFAAASVIQRRFVRLYDDRITAPILTGVYDHNMEHNPKEEIKGDYSIVPLGSSALLEKERHSQNVVAALNLAASPLIRPRLNIHALVEEAFKVLRLGHVVYDRKTAEENVAKEAKAAQEAAQAELQAKGKPGQDPSIVQKDFELREREIAARETKTLQEGEIHRQRLSVEVQKMADAAGLKREDIMARLGIAKLNVDSANQRFNAEIAVKQRQGEGI